MESIGPKPSKIFSLYEYARLVDISVVLELHALQVPAVKLCQLPASVSPSALQAVHPAYKFCSSLDQGT